MSADSSIHIQMLKIILICTVAFLPLKGSSQSTSEELGKYLFSYFKEGAISKIDNLVPTLEELKKLAEKLGIKKDSEQYTDALKGYDSEIEKFRENINAIYSDTLDNQLSWEKAEFQKVIAVSDSIKIDESDPDSKTALVTRLSIYFVCNSHEFRITIDDAFELNGLWKLGNNIYLKAIN